MAAEKKKGKEEPQKRVVLGRVSNSLKIGVVGLPNVGKSTLFNILTRMNVPAENYPFCTLDPNISRVAVPDERFDWLVSHFKPASAVQAFLQVTDIAGLVRGASRGEGLGNAFLSHIRAVDGIYHVVRIFEDVEVTHVEGEVDPVRDLEIISEELRLKDLEALTSHISDLEKIAGRDKTKKPELDIVRKVFQYVNDEKKDVRFGDWKAAEIEVINTLQLLTAKPVIYLVNMSEPDYISKRSKWLAKIKAWVDARYTEPIIPFCAALEAKLLEMENDEQRKQYLTEQKTTSGIAKIIRTGYHALELIHFFTSGTDEVKCWTIKNGTLAPQAAGTIHTDFEKGFICAEVMKYTDFHELGSESAAKAAGKYLQQGKNYVVSDGDIIFFKAGQVKKK